MPTATTRKTPTRFSAQLTPAATPPPFVFQPWHITRNLVRGEIRRLLGDTWVCTDDDDDGTVTAHRGSVRIVVSLQGDWRVRAVVLCGKRATQQTQVGVPQAVIPDALRIAQG